MLKTKGWMFVVLVAAAVLFPAAPAQSSELVKLGKLIVTGKRASAVDARPGQPAATGRDGGVSAAPATDRWFPKAAGEVSAERQGTPAILPNFKLSVDAGEAAPESSELPRPASELPRERVGKLAPAVSAA